MALYNILRALVIAGAVMALVFVALCVVVAAIMGAVVYGLVNPNHSPASALRNLAANASAAVALVQAQPPR